MRSLKYLLRLLVYWWLPALAMLLTIAVGFVVWALGSQPGTRFLLQTVSSQFGGEVREVRGSILGGLNIGHFSLNDPAFEVLLENARLDVNWLALGSKRLQIRELFAGRVLVALHSSKEDSAPEQGDEAPFAMPALPVSIALDKLAVGRFELLQDGQALPVGVSDVEAALFLGAAQAQLVLTQGRVTHEQAEVDLSADLRLSGLQDPWPLSGWVQAKARGATAESVLCVPARVQRQDTADACVLDLTVAMEGSLDTMTTTLAGSGAGLSLRAQADLLPRAPFPVRMADIVLDIAQGGSIEGKLDWSGEGGGQTPDWRAWKSNLKIRGLDLSRWLPADVPQAVISADLDVDGRLDEQGRPLDVGLDMRMGPGALWNRQAVSGSLALRADMAGPDWTTWRLPSFRSDLKVGDAGLRGNGAWGRAGDKLVLDVAVPAFGMLWPDLEGRADLKAEIEGTLQAHRLRLEGHYAPRNVLPGVVGQGPASARLNAAGAWSASTQGWRGQLSQLQAEHAGFSLALQQALPLSLDMPPGQPLQWRVGKTTLLVGLPDDQQVAIDHELSAGAGERIQSKGRIPDLVLSSGLVDKLKAAFQQADSATADARGGVVVLNERRSEQRVNLSAEWDLVVAQHLTGTVSIERRGGDILIPGEPQVALGLDKLRIEARARAAGARGSQVDIGLELQSQRVGSASGEGSLLLVRPAAGGWALSPTVPIRGALRADLADLSWLALLTGDSLEVGGSLRADVQAEGLPGKDWDIRGSVSGEKLRVVRVDDGIRLVDGRLAARFDGDRLLLDELYFPASVRVEATEWRTREWIAKESDVKNGYVKATGDWNLMASAGKIRVEMHHFPAMQRTDRYAMLSGAVEIDAALPKVSVTGSLTADAGWFGLDMLSSVPRVDDDVVVVRSMDQHVAQSSALDLSMQLKIDLGPRFYIVGLGIDAGLVGSLEITLRDGRLTGMGTLRTRAGRIEAYGQRLRLQKGILTFQGSLENPLLDIEALRNEGQVRAGVRVVGTAQRPRIDLISYPEVSDVEKLSWLLLGRGPDEGGGDTSMLLSLGASLIGGNGEPFYRRFGLDDVGIRSGSVGSSGSLLPDVTVAGSVNRTGDDDLSSQFIYASKTFADGITVGIEQALSGSETVGRIGYRLAQGLSLDLKTGTVNGLELIYRLILPD